MMKDEGRDVFNVFNELKVLKELKECNWKKTVVERRLYYILTWRSWLLGSREDREEEREEREEEREEPDPRTAWLADCSWSTGW